MIELRLPMEVFDKKAICAARFKQCFTFLVMLYFLQNLSENHDFSVDFAHPIDGKLANFLQSTASVQCLARGGGLQIDEIPGNFNFDDDRFSVNSASSYFQQSNASSYGPYPANSMVGNIASNMMPMTAAEQQLPALTASNIVGTNSTATAATSNLVSNTEPQHKQSKLNISDISTSDLPSSPSIKTVNTEESFHWKQDANERHSISSIVSIKFNCNASISNWLMFVSHRAVRQCH